MKKKHLLYFIFYLFYSSLFSQNITLSEKKFKIGDEIFTPIGVNFALGFKFIDNEIYFNIAKDQCINGYCGNTKNEINSNLISLITEIEDKGFNTLRIAGFAMYKKDFSSKLNYVGSSYINGISSKISNFTPYINAIESAIEIIENNSNLKVIIITGSHGVDDINIRHKYTSYLQQLKEKLEKYDCIFAYDVYNEPPFFTVKHNYKKCEIVEMTNEWYNALTGKHLVTIGLFGTLDIFQFDPEIVSVDFINFHIFPYLLDWNNYNYKIAETITARDYKWYMRNVKKTWIIGETSFPGSNFHNSTNLALGTESEQEDFANYTINAVKKSHGIGIVWWQYSEVSWYDLEDNNPVVRNNCYGIRYSDINNVPNDFAFTWKKAADILPQFNNLQEAYLNVSDEDYYNPKNFTYNGIKGKIMGDNNLPIVDAKIIIHYKYLNNNKSTIVSNQTYSDKFGFFHVFAPSANYELTGVDATAAGYNFIKLKNADIPIKNFYEFKLDKVQKSCLNKENNNNKDFFSIFPSPAKDFIKISINENNTKINTIEVINGNGKEILIKNNLNNLTTQILIDLQNKPKGFYIIKINHTKGVWVKSIVLY